MCATVCVHRAKVSKAIEDKQKEEEAIGDEVGRAVDSLFGMVEFVWHHRLTVAPWS